MDDWTQRGLAASRKAFRHAWLLLAGGLVLACAGELAARLVDPATLSSSLQIGVSTASTALLEIGIMLVIFGRTLVRAASAGLLADISRRRSELRPSSQPRLARAGLLLFAEVLALSLIAWFAYRWGLGGVDVDSWPFTPALPFLMITDVMSFVALLVASGMILVGAARSLAQK